MRRICHLGWLSVVVLLMLGRPSTLLAQLDPDELLRVEQLQDTLADVAEEVRPSVVAIRAYRRLDPPASGPNGATRPGEGGSSGSTGRLMPAIGTGVVIDPAGLILTNEHVIHDAAPDAIECVLTGDQRYTVRGITSDPRSDLAVIRIDAAGLQPARLGSPDTVRQGHFAIVMGNPFGTAADSRGAPVMSFGIISSLGQDLTRKLDPDRYYGNLIQTDARINPGNSGGPLINLAGEVIGVTTAISSRTGGSEGVGYAIAIDARTRRIIDQLAHGEEVEYGYLGIGLDQPSPEDYAAGSGSGTGGALVTAVGVGTPAHDAGLHAGDIVVTFDGEAIDGVDKLVRIVGAARVGEPVRVGVLRNGSRLDLTVTPARRDDVPRGVNIEPPFTWRGMSVSNPTPKIIGRFNLSESTRGIVVTYVNVGGVADEAGIEPGQVITRIGDDAIRGVRRLLRTAPQLEGPVTVVISGDPPREITLP